LNSPLFTINFAKRGRGGYGQMKIKGALTIIVTGLRRTVKVTKGFNKCFNNDSLHNVILIYHMTYCAKGQTSIFKTLGVGHFFIYKFKKGCSLLG
jgi:hypothetical protein